MQETHVRSLGWEDPWRRKWQATPVFLPGEPQGQRRLVGYSTQGHKRVGHDLATKKQQHHQEVIKILNWGNLTEDPQSISKNEQF